MLAKVAQFRVMLQGLVSREFCYKLPVANDLAVCWIVKSGGKMHVQALIIWLIVGAIAGWLAGMVVKGGSYGLIGDIIVGIIGGFIAGWLLPRLDIVIGGGFRSSTPSSARSSC